MTTLYSGEKATSINRWISTGPYRLWVASVLFLAWTVVAVMSATTAFLAYRAQSWADWLSPMRPMFFYYGIWTVCSAGIYTIVSREKKSKWHVFRFTGVHLLLFSGMALITPFLVAPSNWEEWMYGDRAVAFHGLTAVIYLFCLLGATLFDFYFKLQRSRKQQFESEVVEAELRSKLSLARFDALKTQINPHFIFNALNSIASLTVSNQNNEAYAALQQLGDLLRGMLDNSNNRLVRLDTELHFVRQYIRLEQLRYGSRLTMTEDVEARCLKLQVPVFTLQPVVENVVKHVLARTNLSVEIVLKIKCRSDNRLHISVIDNGVGFSEESLENLGVGLFSVGSRLQLLYGEHASIKCYNGSDGGAVVILSLPVSDMGESVSRGGVEVDAIPLA